MPFISFIIPVYNIRKFLTECIESITSQQFADWEIILVDDKSTDGSGELCDQFAAADPRITCVHLPSNSGPGTARNTGLEHATGEYVYFMDGDDVIAAKELHRIRDAIIRANEPDMVKVEHIEPFGRITDGNRKNGDGLATIRVSSTADFLKPFLNQTKIGFQTWQFLIRTSLLRETGIRFRAARICEDNEFTLRVVMAAKTVGEYKAIFYYWRTRLAGSLTSAHVSNWDQIIIAAVEMLEYACCTPMPVLYKRWALRNVYSIVVQFEDIAGGVEPPELRRHPDLFAPFERYQDELAEYINDRNLLWHIKEHGASAGVVSFCRQRSDQAHALLASKACRDVFLFPATRKCLRLLEVLSANGYCCKGMLDNDKSKQGLMLDGRVIFNPEIIPLCYGDSDALFIIISTYKKSTGKALADQLRSYGLEEGRHFVSTGFEME